MATLERLRSDIQRLKSGLQPLAGVPEDPREFAAAAGLEELDAWQRQALTSDAPRQLYNCCRQSGKSSIAGVLGLHTALSRPGSLTLALAPSERQSKELFAKIAAFYRRLGKALPSDSYRKLGMELINGSRIEALPGSEKTIRGFSGVDLLLVDEAARVPDELYHALRPMLAVSRGRLLMMSTPFGKRGVFHQEWAQGVGWERYEVRAEEVPRIPDSFLGEERASLPARIYRQEYECSFEEAEDSVFAYEDVDRAITAEVEPLFGAANV